MPEERVQYMSGEMKGEVFLQLVDGREITFLPSLGQFLERRVRAGDVAGMVFVVMKLEEPRRVMRFRAPRSHTISREAYKVYPFWASKNFSSDEHGVL